MRKTYKTTRRSFITSLAAIGSTPVIGFALPPLASPIEALMDKAFNSMPDYCGHSFKSVLNNPSYSLAAAVWLPKNISKKQIESYFKSHASKFTNLETRRIYIYEFGTYEDSPYSTNPQTPSEIRIAAMTTGLDESYQGAVTIETGKNARPLVERK